jgi:predicted AlkP superfamily phosphohydrolase/phosphomutase
MSKTLIIGLDGATFDLLRPWAEQGKLPNLQRLMEQGTWSPLESTLPPMTSPAWPSFATGKYPSKHGVFDFVSARQGNFNIVNATAIDAAPLWDLLSAQGKRVGVINVPVTYPPHPVNGFMISGLLSPTNAQVTYPDDLLQPYRHEAQPYRVMPSIQYKPGNESVFIEDLETLIETRVVYATRLMQDRPWDFVMVHILATDLVQHALWRHMDADHPGHEPGNPYQDAIQRIYQKADTAVGDLLDQVDDETTVIVMSDHGFGPLHGIINLNMLLWRAGLLRFKRTPLAQLRAFTFRHGLTPSAAYRWLARLGLQNIVARVSKSARNAVFDRFLSFNDVDWDRTLAYSMGHMGQIYVNSRREHPGTVKPSGSDEANQTGHDDGQENGKEQSRNRVIDALSTLTTPDGRPMLDLVVRQSALTPGPHQDEGPDLHVVLDSYRYISCPLFATDGNVISRQIRGDSGSHRVNGILIARGPQIQPSAALDQPRIVDLAPTVLHLMGCPVPADMDGRVLFEALTPEAAEAVPTQAAEPNAQARDAHVLSQDEEAELEARLKGLGYLG